MDSQKSRLLKSWRPLIFTSQILGLTFFTGKIPRIATALYRAFILVFLILSVIDQIPLIVYWTALQANTVDKTLQLIKISVAWSNYFLIFLVTAFKNEDISGIINGLTELDLIISEKVHRVIFYRQILFLLLNFVPLSLYQVTAVMLSPPEVKKEYFSAIYIFINSFVVSALAQFFELLLLLREYYKCLNRRMVTLKDELLTEYGGMNELIIRKEINRLRVLHFDLYDTCKRVNKCYQLQLLLVLIRCFVEGTSTSAELMANDSSENYILSTTSKLTHMAFDLLLVVEICYCCYVTVGESKSIVAQISVLSNMSENEEVKNELELFSIQTLHIPLNFSIFTLFNLNLELLTKMILSISSYIIIIYTFETSHDE